MKKPTAKKASAKVVKVEKFMKVKPAVFPSKLTGEQEFLTVKKVADYLIAHPKQARAVLVDAGIYTKAGKLTKAYGG